MATSKRELAERLPHRLQIGPHVINPIRELTITENIDKELKRQPGLFAWYGSLHAKAYKMWQVAKQDALEREEDLQGQYKEHHPKCKEADAKLYAKRDKRLRELWRRQTDLNLKRNTMYICLQAAEQRGYLLQSLGANKRKVQTSPDSVRKHRYNGDED